MNATPQELHSQRLTSASLSKQDATSEGTVRSERCYKVQSRRHKQAPQHEPDKSTAAWATLVVAQTPRQTRPVTPVGATLVVALAPWPVPLSKGWANVRESGRRRPSTTKGRGYSTSSGLTERRRTALLKQPNSGPTVWQRGQTLELMDGPTSNPRKRGDETNPLGRPPLGGGTVRRTTRVAPARGGNVRRTKGAHQPPPKNQKPATPPQAIPTYPSPERPKTTGYLIIPADAGTQKNTAHRPPNITAVTSQATTCPLSRWAGEG